jgi:hypothetical protein
MAENTPVNTQITDAVTWHIASDGIEIRANPSNQRHPRSMRYLQAGFFLNHRPLTTRI